MHDGESYDSQTVWLNEHVCLMRHASLRQVAGYMAADNVVLKLNEVPRRLCKEAVFPYVKFSWNNAERLTLAYYMAINMLSC